MYCPSFEKKYLLPKYTLCHVKLKLELFLSRRFSKVIFSRCRFYLPIEKRQIASFEINWISKDDLWEVWLKLAHWFWSIIFSKVVNIFSLSYYYIPLEKDKDFIWAKLNSLDRWMFGTKSSWNWFKGSGKVNICEQIRMHLKRQKDNILQLFCKADLSTSGEWANAC